MTDPDEQKTVLISREERKEQNFHQIVLNILFHLLVAINLAFPAVLILTEIKSGGVGSGQFFSVLLVSIFLFALTFLHLVSAGIYKIKKLIFPISLLLLLTSISTLTLIISSPPAYQVIRTIHPEPIIIEGFITISALFAIWQIALGWRKTSSPSEETEGFPEQLRRRYSDLSPIKTGGVGTIWYGRRITDNVEVAIKFPGKVDALSGRSFLREIRLWESLNHPAIVKIYDANILPVPYLEMEYLPESLRDSKVPIEPELAIRIILNITEGLEFAHRKGISHCDIKPSNILINYEGKAKITDWGIAQFLYERNSFQGLSPDYAAPEQISGEKCTQRSDIYQIGLLFIWLLSGTRSLDGMNKFCKQYPRIGSIIKKCIETDPSMRYESVSALISDLNLLSREFTSGKRISTS